MHGVNSEDLHSAALAYHRLPRPGKLEIQATKPLANQRDLALAYSPGVAAACTEIANNPAEAATLTARANLVAVVSNGTAVLGLGNIGPLASKPVMEGKAVLFKKFAGIDVFDIEIAADTIERVVETVAALEPTFGGINLEDIKGPECFEIEAQLKARMKIPVFHDDQHGTAIIVGAAITNALLLNGKKLADCKIVASGAGAAAIACLNLLVSLGAQRKNIWVCDIDGVVHEGRNTLMDRWKAVYAQKTDKRVLADVIGGADIFLGLVRAQRAEARDGQADGGQAAGDGAGQSEPGNHAGRSPQGPPRRDDLHRALGLPEPGQQRPVLSVHLPRRARCRRHRDQRGHEARRGRRDRAIRARSAVGCDCARFRQRRDPGLRPGLADPEPVRSAADPAHRAGGGQGGDEVGRRHRVRSRISRIMPRSSNASRSAPAWS